MTKYRELSSKSFWRKRCGVVASVLLLFHGSAGLGGVAGARSHSGSEQEDVQKEPDSIQNTNPWGEGGRRISIPEFPGVSVPQESLEDAIRFSEKLLAGWRWLRGDGLSVARGLGALADLYSRVGNVSKAESLYDEAQGILERSHASRRDFGWLHNNRGYSRLEQKRFAGAVSSFRAAIEILGRGEEEELLDSRAIVLQNLALTYSHLGDVETSESLFLEALSMLRRHRREWDHPVFLAASNNLGALYGLIGDFEAARGIFEDLLAHGRFRRSSDRFVILNHLGMALRSLGELNAAERRLQEALKLTTEGSPERLAVLANLAATHFEAGSLGISQIEAEEALRLAEALEGPGSLVAAACEAALGTMAMARGDLAAAEQRLIKAQTVFSSASAGEQRSLAELTQTLAIVVHRRGQRERARELGREALELETRNLRRVLAFGSEAQRLSYQSKAFYYDYLAALGEAPLLAEAVLSMKGAVLESLLVERALVRKSKSPADRERLDRIYALKVELMEKIGRGETRIDALERALKEEESALAKSLARPVLPERPHADVARVQAALEGDQVLIEIIGYQVYEAGWKLVPWYGGLVIPHQGSPAWVPLGRAEGLEESIRSLVDRLDAGSRGAQPVSALGDVTRTLRELDDRLWKPLAKVFPQGTRKVLLSPDGALSFVPWAALLDENEKFIAERWQLAQVASGRDLLRTASKASEKTLLALADGKEDLPYAQQEVESLARRAREQGWRPTVLLGEQASEAALSQRPSPRILHFATHGGALQGDWAQAVGDRLSKRPMYRGFLWLGGAEKTLEAWKRGRVLPFSDDGILTAEEVGGLDLGGTWLTVLSACQSGAGDARSGEGVLGLRRGFALAGTENLLFTLWSVDDESTARFMEAFYDRLFQTMDLPRAFQEAQVAELLRWKDRGIPVAVFRAGAFVLTH